MDTKFEQKVREKEIERAAKAYSSKKCMDKMAAKAINQYNKSNREELEEAFIAGAKFADDFPRQGLVEIEDVEDIYMAWLRERERFMDYLKGRCIKAGWL